MIPMFIYVMSKDACKKMMSLGYTLLKEDTRNKVYVFENKPDMSFDSLDFPHVVSSMLTF